MSSSEEVAKGPDEKFCSNCGEIIAKSAEICPDCGVRQAGTSVIPAEKNPAIAAILSFVITGLGQIYNGQIAKGILLHVGMWFAIIIAVFFFWLIIPLFFPLVLWVFNIWDAYDQAQKINLSAAD